MKRIENLFVADGRGRIIKARRTAVRNRIRQRYAAQLHSAGRLRRIALNIRIRREVQKELNKLAPRDGLYART